MNLFGTLKNNVTQGLDVVKQLLVLADKVEALSKRVHELESVNYHRMHNEQMNRKIKWAEKDKK